MVQRKLAQKLHIVKYCWNWLQYNEDLWRNYGSSSNSRIGKSGWHLQGDHLRVHSSGVNFINVLQAAFTCADPKSTKRLKAWLHFFALVGSVHIKAMHKHMKLTPGRQKNYSRDSRSWRWRHYVWTLRKWNSRIVEHICIILYHTLHYFTHTCKSNITNMT